MGTTRRSGARWLRTGCAAVAASTALAALASTAVTLGAAGSPVQSSVTAGAVINSVGFSVAVTSRAWIGDPRLDEVRQLTASRRGSELEAEQPGSPPTLVLEWVELPARGSEAVAANGLLSLRVMNLSPLAAFGLYRWDNDTSDTIISIGFSEDDDNGCGDSSSMFGDSTSYIESLRAHLIKIGHCDTTDQTESRKKMLVTHELGHSMARLYYGHDGAESPIYSYYVPFGFDETDPNYAECVNTLGYDLTSLEANSLAFKEGFADFYSARVWNNSSAHGTYQRFGTPVDLEAWDAAGGVDTPGGYTLNVCGSVAIGVSTRSDYLRFFWDWHTTAACMAAPSQHDMLELYRRVRENDRTGTYPLTNWNYDDALLNAVATTVEELSGCMIGRAFIYLGHNNGG